MHQLLFQVPTTSKYTANKFKIKNFSKYNQCSKKSFYAAAMRSHKQMQSETAQKTWKLPLLCKQPRKRMDIQVMCLHNPHNMFNLLMNFQISYNKNLIPDPYYSFRVIGCNFLQFSL